MNPTMSVTEEELHAWLDGELPPEREREVEAYLAAHPEEMRRLEEYRADGEALARVFAYADVAAVRAPLIAPRRAPVFTGWRRAAAVLLIFGAGAASGWLGRDRAPMSNDDLTRFAGNAALAHVVLARGGTEELVVAGIPRQDLEARMSEALGVRVKLPDAERLGYRLVGGTFVPTSTGRAVQLAFRDASGSKGTEISVYFEGKPGASETPFRRFDAGGGITTMAWEDDDVACAISGTVPADRLERMGRLVYEALES